MAPRLAVEWGASMNERRQSNRALGRRRLSKAAAESFATTSVAASEVAAGEDALPERPRGGPYWLPRPSLALSAFIMSLAVTLISAYYALQGPEVLVRPPQQILLYRDGEGQQSILGFDVRLDMINSATDYGDVMLDAALSPADSGASFRFQNVMRPVFTGAAAVSDECELGSRCISHPGLKLIEQPDVLVDVAGGAARAMHLSFPAAQWNCEGAKAACARFATFNQAAAAIGARPLDVRITLKLNGDGIRQIRCRGGKVDISYLKGVGWMTLACEQSEVQGEPWL